MTNHRKNLSLVLAAVVCAAPVWVRAETSIGEKISDKAASVQGWFRQWKSALQKKAIQSRYRRNARATSVAAIRGAGQKDQDANLPYWKGSWSDKKAEDRLKEREEQSAAIDLILEGRFQEAKQAMDAFEKAHPRSGYLADIQEAREQLKLLEAADKTADGAAAPTAEELAMDKESDAKAAAAQEAEQKALLEKKAASEKAASEKAASEKAASEKVAEEKAPSKSDDSGVEIKSEKPAEEKKDSGFDWKPKEKVEKKVVPGMEY